MGQLVFQMVLITAMVAAVACLCMSVVRHFWRVRIDHYRKRLLAQQSTGSVVTDGHSAGGPRHLFQRRFSRAGETTRARLSRDALLAWIASSDGKISSKEHALLRRIHGPRDDLSEFEIAVGAGSRASVDDLMLACETVRDLEHPRKRLFLEQAVRVAVADKEITIAKNHVLRFLAELTDIPLGSVYRRITGRPLPFPGDPSSVRWWEGRRAAKTRKRAASSQHFDQADQRPEPSRRTITRLEALRILGLGQEASLEDIRKAYFKSATIHHPDRFADLGDEAASAAAKTFQRINEAYEVLETDCE